MKSPLYKSGIVMYCVGFFTMFIDVLIYEYAWAIYSAVVMVVGLVLLGTSGDDSVWDEKSI